MRRTYFALMLIAFVGCIGFYPHRVVGDGGTELEVHIETRSGRPIAAVMVEPCRDSSDAEETLEWLTSRYAKVVQSPYRGESLNVWIDVTEILYEAMFWRKQSGYTQSSNALAIVVEYQDGERQGKVVEIPDLRQRRTVVVTLP